MEMDSTRTELSAEARAALRRENRIAFLRSMAIAFGFAAFPSFFVSPRFDFSPFVCWVCFGVPMGIAMPALHQYLLDRVRHRSFLLTIFFQSALYAVTIYVALTLSIGAVIFIYQARIRNPGVVFLEVTTYPAYFLGIFGALLMIVPVRFFFALSQKLGPGVLGKWIRGYYHVPREEERIFMFLDMKDSTTLAERLGNLKFSALVRDFFQDMTLPVLQTKAEVSHYIGDEAVLTWTIPRGVADGNCVRIFFEFQKAIDRRAEYYSQTYGLVPEFKAGAHLGLVVATEVGEVKSEIVYHGDVLNTAARIQGLCNGTGEALLLSKELADQVSAPEGTVYAQLGPFELKGKEEEMDIVAARKG